MPNTYPAFREFGPCNWWVWNGDMNKPQMLRQMDLMKQAGVDEFYIYCEQGVELDFLEEEFFERVGWTVQEAKKRNMRVWIYDDLNWPSGTANGLMVRNHPEYRSQMLEAQRVEIAPNDYYFHNVTGEHLGVYIRRDPDAKWEKIELVNNMWQNTTGQTVELFCSYTKYFNYDMMCSTGAKNSKAYRGYCDFLNPKAVQCWMGFVHEQYYKRFGKEFGKTIRGFFYDEPFTTHYAGVITPWPRIPWTPGLFEKFEKTYGYDFREWLPIIFYETKRKTYPNVEQVRQDYWNLITTMTTEAFSKTIAEWCAKHHVQSTGHTVGEEFVGDGQRFRLLFCADPHKHLMYHQIPGMDLLTDNTPYHLDTTAHWYGTEPGTQRIFTLTAKQPCSTARYSGAKRVMAEAMGVQRLNIALSFEKLTYDWLAGCGVSMLDDNSLPFTCAGFGRNFHGTNKSWNQPWFKYYHIFSDYVRTMSKFASQSYLNADTCVLISESTIHACTPAAHDSKDRSKDGKDAEVDAHGYTLDGHIAEASMAVYDALLRDHVEFELMWEDILVDAKVSKGKLLAPNSAFKTIIVPQTSFTTPAVAKKLADFAKSGGQVIFVGCRPSRGVKKMPDFSGCKLLNHNDVDFAKQLTALIEERPYRLIGKGTEMIFTAMRGNQLLLSNQSTSTVSFKLETSLPRPWKAIVPGDDTNAWEFEGNDVILEPQQSLLLEGGTATTGIKPVSYEFCKKGTPLAPTEWQYTLERPNNARLRMELGLAPNGESVENVKCWVPVGRDGVHGFDFSQQECPEYWLRGEFEAKVLPEKLQFIVDSKEYDRVIVNGKEFTASTPYTLYDWQNRSFDITSAVKKGVNRIVVHSFLGPFTGASPIHSYNRSILFHNNISTGLLALHGNFGVEYDDSKTMLVPLPKTLKLGEITDQKLPSYLGDVTLTTTVNGGKKPAHIYLPNVVAGAVKVVVNGKELGVRLWGPYVFDCTPASWKTNSKNVISITLSGNLGHLLKRRYGCMRFLYVPFGLLEAPVLG